MRQPRIDKPVLLVLVLATLLVALGGQPASSAVLRVSWDKSPDAAVAKYLLYSGTSPGQYGSPLEVVPAQGGAALGTDGKYTTRLGGLLAGQRYYVSVRAVNTAGAQSEPSAEVSATTYGDRDGDGISDEWEQSYGLNPDDPADAALDTDGDGVTNLQEYAAGSDPGTVTYRLTASVNPAGGGTVSPSSGTYTGGAAVNVSATAAAGYQFDHWGGSAGGTANPLSLTMSADKDVVAYFTQAGGGSLTHFPRPAPQPNWVDFYGYLRICGVSADPGDEVAVFDPQGVPCGLFVVDTAGYYGFLHVYGDNPDTPQDEGASPGDVLIFKVWQAASEREFTAVAAASGQVLRWTSNGEQWLVDLECPCSQSIPLQRGWNLVSFATDRCYHTTASPPAAPAAPMLPGLTYQWVAGISEALASIEGKYDVVRSFDQDGAHTFDPDMDSHFSDLTYLAPGYGYWIKATEECTLTLAGNPVPPQAALPLRQGWNLVGCWADRVRHCGQPPEVEFASCEGTALLLEPVGTQAGLLVQPPASAYEVLRSFDIDGAHTYAPALPAFADLHYVGPGYGYWIKMKGEGALSY